MIGFYLVLFALIDQTKIVGRDYVSGQCGCLWHGASRARQFTSTHEGIAEYDLEGYSIHISNQHSREFEDLIECSPYKNINKDGRSRIQIRLLTDSRL